MRQPNFGKVRKLLEGISLWFLSVILLVLTSYILERFSYNKAFLLKYTTRVITRGTAERFLQRCGPVIAADGNCKATDTPCILHTLWSRNARLISMFPNCNGHLKLSVSNYQLNNLIPSVTRHFFSLLLHPQALIASLTLPFQSTCSTRWRLKCLGFKPFPNSTKLTRPYLARNHTYQSRCCFLDILPTSMQGYVDVNYFNV